MNKQFLAVVLLASTASVVASESPRSTSPKPVAAQVSVVEPTVTVTEEEALKALQDATGTTDDQAAAAVAGLTVSDAKAAEVDVDADAALAKLQNPAAADEEKTEEPKAGDDKENDSI